MPIEYRVRLDHTAPDLGLAPAPSVVRTEVFHATPEAGQYSHHGHLVLHDGRVFAMWSNHPVDEDAPGQRVLMATSEDRGDSWSSPVEILPPVDHLSNQDADGHGRRTMCANGFVEVDDRLYAIGEVWQHGGNYRKADMGLGRLARDVQGGTPFWLGEAPAPLAGVPSFPAGEADLVARIQAEFTRPENFPGWDFVGFTSDFELPTGEWMCEPTSSWQLPSGELARFFRDFRKSQRNYVSMSPDGIRWTDPVPTVFPDASARTSIVQLGDGTVIATSNPRTGVDGAHSGRDPLVASVSLDGLAFDSAVLLAQGARPQRYPGRWKAPGFHYPHAIVIDDELLVIYSVNKEDIEVARVALSNVVPSAS